VGAQLPNRNKHFFSVGMIDSTPLRRMNDDWGEDCFPQRQAVGNGYVVPLGPKSMKNDGFKP